VAESKFSSLSLRAFTGILLMFIVASAWYVGSYALLALICLVSLVGQMEFCNLFLGKSKQKEKFTAMIVGLLYIIFSYFHYEFISQISIILVFLIFALFSLISFSQENALSNMKSAGVMFISFLYIPVIFFLALSFTPLQQLMVVCIPIASDTAAYFAGIMFGKHKIWASVSPKKSIEGSLVGLIAAVLVLVYFGIEHNTMGTQSLAILIPVGIFLGILTQMGDFFESGLKRSVNIKDSGNVLPGHGGVLDRTDSLIFTIASFEICNVFIAHII